MKNLDRRAYNKYYNKFWKLRRRQNKELKNKTYYQNIVWPPLIKINIYEIVVKFIIRVILFVAAFSTLRKHKHKFNEMINRAYNKFSSSEFIFIPPASAFYLLVSFIPVIIVSYLLLNVFSNLSSAHLYLLNIILPKLMPDIQLVVEFLSTDFSQAAAVASLLLLGFSSLWVSSAGYGKIITSQNYIYNHKYLGSGIGNRVKGLFLVLGISMYFTIFVLLSYFIDSFIYGLTAADIAARINTDTSIINFIVLSLIFLYTGFLILFKFSPSFKLSFKSIHSGSLISTIPTWILVSIFGSLTSATSFSQYGPLGIFLYLSILIAWFTFFFYLGIIVNEAYYKTFISQRTIQKKVLFKL